MRVCAPACVCVRVRVMGMQVMAALEATHIEAKTKPYILKNTSTRPPQILQDSAQTIEVRTIHALHHTAPTAAATATACFFCYHEVLQCAPWSTCCWACKVHAEGGRWCLVPGAWCLVWYGMV